MNKNHLIICMATALVLMTIAFVPKHLTSVSGNQQQSSSMRDQNREKIEQKKASFKSGRDLLLKHGVPFDPDLLMEPGFQKRLAPVFAKMPLCRRDVVLATTKCHRSRVSGIEVHLSTTVQWRLWKTDLTRGA